LARLGTAEATLGWIFAGAGSGFVAIVLAVSRVEAIANAVSKTQVQCHLQARRIGKFPVNLAVLPFIDRMAISKAHKLTELYWLIFGSSGPRKERAEI
jgi:hypothetical protein